MWGIASAVDGIFPIQWSSTEPVLEFPVDLLFYNFLMPLAVKFFKPSTGLSKTYDWWFRKCARLLRLTHFLLGERKLDEQGRHVRLTWRAWLRQEKGNAAEPMIDDSIADTYKEQEVDAYFLHNGQFFKAPGSDQVRIPKGQPTFVQIDSNGKLIGLDSDSEAIHERNPELFTKVYIPPFFRFRIGLLIFMIWLFAAGTGVTTTILPLLLGRYIFSLIMPDHLRMNDIYSFSIGIYILGGTLYAGLNLYHSKSYILNTLKPYTPNFARETKNAAVHLLGLIYIYSFLAILLLPNNQLLFHYPVTHLHNHSSPKHYIANSHWPFTYHEELPKKHLCCCCCRHHHS